MLMLLMHAGHALVAAHGLRVVDGNVAAHLAEVGGRDGLHSELLHRLHLDEQLVDQDPKEDEEDSGNLTGVTK